MRTVGFNARAGPMTSGNSGVLNRKWKQCPRCQWMDQKVNEFRASVNNE